MDLNVIDANQSNAPLVSIDSYNLPSISSFLRKEIPVAELHRQPQMDLSRAASSVDAGLVILWWWGREGAIIVGRVHINIFDEVIFIHV